jgi:hypothetical protein
MKRFLFVSIFAGFLFYVFTYGARRKGQNLRQAEAPRNKYEFRCPMHPEIKGNKGDRCVKCGMMLEWIADVAPRTEHYYMQFSMAPEPAAPGQDVSMSFIPKIKGKESENVILETQHDKKIHLILVNDDLSWFDHIHPEYNGNGSYSVTEKFPAPGKYIAFADYKPAGSPPIVDKHSIQVKGKPANQVAYDSEKLSGISGNYTFELQQTSGRLVSGTSAQMTGSIKKNGKTMDANLLENYLGAKAHFVVVSLAEKDYLHIHPQIVDGAFQLHTTFRKPGIHRGWAQFIADGKLHTIDFTLKVEEGSVAQSSEPGHSHHNEHLH